MRYVFDLDNTLCVTEGMDYANAKPIPERIAAVTRLFELGHHVTIDTGRAAEHKALTMDQLRRWGPTCHVVRVGQKPPAEVYVDDRAEHPDTFFAPPVELDTEALTQRGEVAANLGSRWSALYPGEGLLLTVSERKPDSAESEAILNAVATVMPEPWHAVYVARGKASGETFATPQCSWPLAPATGFIAGPAIAAEQLELVGDHSPEAIRAVGAWRWPLVSKHRELILRELEGKRAIDFGGLAGSVGYGAIVVDHGAEYRAIYDVPGQVDTVFTSHTLEHVEDVETCLGCIRRKLTTGGALIAQVPSWRFESLRAENWPHHVHTFRLSCRVDPEAPARYTALDVLVSGWAEIELAEDDGECILLIARKR